jgi:hypothetical protein
MKCWRRVCAAVGAVAAFILCGFVVVGVASAGEDEDAQTMLFSGRDIWRNGAFAYGGVVYAPGGLDQDGLLLKILLSGGLYGYHAVNLGGERVTGTEWLAQVLPGWRIKRGDAEFKFFMGPDIEIHRLSPDDPDNKLRGRSFGLRMAAELWYEPAPDKMIAADVSLSSIATSDTARIAYGWRILDGILSGGVYVGPELQYFGSDGYRHGRIGAHVTTMKTADIEWSAACGWARDSAGSSSPYLRLNLLKRY